MTGRGCDDIFRILDSRNCTFGDMFRRCERRYGLDNFHFTRLDIAIDDKNEKPFFTIEQIKKKCEKEEFISNSEGYHFDESKFDDFDTAKTVYIGAGKSGLSYRFYDKDKEVCSKHNKTLDEVGSWKRTEMQLRDDKAHAFAMTFKDRPLNWENWLSGYWQTTYALSYQTETKVIKADGKRVDFGNAFWGLWKSWNC